jgi:hypothetical protein
MAVERWDSCEFALISKADDDNSFTEVNATALFVIVLM